MKARLLQSSNRFTAYIIHPIEQKHCKMMIDISPHNFAEPDFPISPQGSLLGRANRFTAYSIYPIELNFGTILLDISPHSRYEQEYFRCRERDSEFQKYLRTSIHFSLSRRRRNLYLLDPINDRSVCSALFFHFITVDARLFATIGPRHLLADNRTRRRIESY